MIKQDGFTPARSRHLDRRAMDTVSILGDDDLHETRAVLERALWIVKRWERRERDALKRQGALSGGPTLRLLKGGTNPDDAA